MTVRRIIVLVAVGLLVGAVAADRWVAGQAASAIEDRLGCRHATATVKGFPVTWQMARGVLDRVRITVDDLAWRDLTVAAEAELSGVSTSKPTEIDRAEVAVVVPWPELMAALSNHRSADRSAMLAGAEMSAAGDQVALNLSGRPWSPRLLLDVELEGSTVTFHTDAVEVAGRHLAAARLAALTGRDLASFDRSYPIRLPGGLRATEVLPDEDGLRVVVVGEDLRPQRGTLARPCDTSGEEGR
ncbi:LmeA family phospholipid-binding protein [Nocardioides stalactiti]|uniref:LmeA family phospholipid-binding protein n=1 Tax=Nocardioides stalactiti TaxID=2755356 RepID=UPI0016012195|nr:DUF2993 domain-containing protein [Nocardioides stalactiti]